MDNKQKYTQLIKNEIEIFYYIQKITTQMTKKLTNKNSKIFANICRFKATSKD